MKKLTFTIATVVLLCACGTNDEMNEAKNFPSYDTIPETNRIVDSVPSDDMRSGENMRHNVDRESENTTG